VQSEHKGRRIRLRLPKEIEGVIPPAIKTEIERDIEELDFFNEPQNRIAVLKRENFRCFYTLKQIDANSCVIDHVVSRPIGNNGYRNVVAASREANNRKGSRSAEEFFRILFREGFLSEQEFAERMQTLSDLRQGLLKPVFE
jgi:hypothetical protein